MILFPAIDLKDGRCVRLRQGDMEQETVFNEDPAAQARDFAAQGFSWLHLVDLDGAVAGHAVNGAAVTAILGATGLETQLGGGIRDLETIEAWLDFGVSRVILGTVALSDPALVAEACRRFPGRIAIAIDSRDGLVATEGWTRTSSMMAGDLARAVEDAGASAIIYTDIGRDGVLSGLDAAAIARFAEPLSTPVIAAGGVSSLDDLRALKRIAAAGIAGVISGRALYDGRLDPAAALALLAEA
jgi:phosphoribosylformimino-5-aminoimidazole carboxamide ribotide isomerase